MYMKLPSFYDIYPLTIISDRYGGTYSGGNFTAWNLFPEDIPPEIFDSDVPCGTFWFEALIFHWLDGLVGIGDTIEEAVINLYINMEAAKNNKEEGKIN